MGWLKTTEYMTSLFPSRFLWTLPLAGVAIVSALIRRERLAIFLAVMALLVGTTFWLLPEAMLWNSRLLPFWYLCLSLLAGLGLAAIGRAVASFTGGADGELVRVVTAIAVATVIVFGVARPLADICTGSSRAEAVSNSRSTTRGFMFGPRNTTGPRPSARSPSDFLSIVGQSVACVTSIAMPT